MTNLSYLALTIFLLSCASSTEEKQSIETVSQESSHEVISDSSQATLHKNEIPYYEREISTRYSGIYQTDSIDIVIQKYLGSHKDSICSESGVDDCATKYCVYTTPGTDVKITIEMTSCGDYGYEVNHFIAKQDSLLAMRRFRFSAELTTGSKPEYKLEENIYYFGGEYTVSKYRSKLTQNTSDSTVNTSPFTIQFIKRDSIYPQEKKKYRSLFIKPIIIE